MWRVDELVVSDVEALVVDITVLGEEDNVPRLELTWLVDLLAYVDLLVGRAWELNASLTVEPLNEA